MKPSGGFQFELRDLFLAVTLFALSLPGLCVLLRGMRIDDLSIWDLFAIAISPPCTGAAIGAIFKRSGRASSWRQSLSTLFLWLF